MKRWKSVLFITVLGVARCVFGQGDEPTTTKAADRSRPKSPVTSQTAASKAAGLKADSQKAMFELLQVREAWKITRGKDNVLVGVIDNGFDFYHPALKGKVTPGYYGEGGYHTEIVPNIAHGTLVAGIIVAQEVGRGGMTGLAPGCRILTASKGMLEHTLLRLQVAWSKEHPNATLDETNKGMMEVMQKHQKELTEFGQNWVRYQTSGTAKSIRYLVDHGARVINISEYMDHSVCSVPEVWKELKGAFKYAASKDVVIVIGAGNIGRRSEDYPGEADTVVVAGASDLKDQRWAEKVDYMGTKMEVGSNFGKRLTVMAPVQNICVCTPHEKRFYSCDDGPIGPAPEEEGGFEGPYEILEKGATSSAAPVVSSLAALVLSARPDLGVKDVVQIIKNGCDDIGEKAYDEYTGYGRVNFAKTLRLAVNWKKANS